MPKYSSYIELSPYYESVVDLDAEERNPNLWQEYIVHEDMKIALDKICQSIKEETKDARRSFWIHGAYGTGKSYAAIVLKHLFEDPIEDIKPFLSKEILLPYRNKFVSIRERGEFLVVWKSGCTGIKNGVHLMMEMEAAICEKLRQKYGEKAYYGSSSLVRSVKDKLNDRSINWEHVFHDQEFGLFEEFGSLEELKSEIMGNDLKATDRVAMIIKEKGWGLFNSVDQFQEWLKDIIAGNKLTDTGIVFIWDEFTGFLRDCGDDNVLQRLSEYCKQQPFYMCLIVHRDPGWVENMGEQTYQRIMHRYHELEFHISESAAYDLIGNSIWIRPGMEEQWKEIKAKLMQSLKNDVHEFDNLEMERKQDRLSQLCPLHPMTLSMLAIVAQNFGASQRTLFRFMKDLSEADENVGFIHFINKYGPDDWRWLTPDFLWDYFFTRDSDVKDLSSDARKCYQHYIEKRDYAGNETGQHVFKAIMLLIAVMSTTRTTHLYSRLNNGRVSPTQKCLYLCFSGQLTKEDLDKYLELFQENGLLRLDKSSSGDVRLELPYSGNADVFSIRLEQIQRKYTRYELFKKKGEIADALEGRIWADDDATSRRVTVCACSSETNSINRRHADLLDELKKSPYAVGVLVIVLKESSEYQTLHDKLKSMAAEDETNHLVTCVLKEPLTDDFLNRWHEKITHKELAAEEGKKGSADKYENEAEQMLLAWVQSAVSNKITAFYKDRVFSAWGKDDLSRQLKDGVIFRIFSAAPERIVSTSTAFKGATESAALSGISGKATSSQLNNILQPLQTAKVYEAASIDELVRYEGSNVVARTVSQLSRYINDTLSKGTRVHLDQMWSDLQKEPFGYFNSLACAGILGAVLRFYVNGQFYWIDETNNTHILTEQTMASMILKICKGQMIGNTLSCGSKAWQNFKEYIQCIFALTDADVVSEEQARKYMREKLVTTGLPFWVMKYLREESFGSVEAKKKACEIVENIGAFINGAESSTEIMENTVALFNGMGPLRKNMTEAFADKKKLSEAFRFFVAEASPPLRVLMEQMDVSSGDLISRIKQVLQSAVYTWSEEDVKTKLDELCWEYELVFVVNSAMGTSCRSISLIGEQLSNYFRSMIVPGIVIETFEKDWTEALRLLSKISKGIFLPPSDQRPGILQVLKTHSKAAWQFVTSSKLMLEEYLRKRGISCQEKELEEIISSLKPVPYDSPEAHFSDTIDRQLGKIEISRNKEELLSIWKEISGTESISEWCKKYATPIQWVVPENDLEHFRILKSIQEIQPVDGGVLKKTLSFFKNTAISYLQNPEYVQNRFFAKVGSEFKDLFSINRDRLLADIRNQLGVDAYGWALKAPEITNILSEFRKKELKMQYLQDVQEKIASMSENTLKNKLSALLDEHPELGYYFVE